MAGGKKILLIEDDADTRWHLREILCSLDHEVFAASNGEEGLHLLSVIGIPDVILLDLMMPVMNGWQFLAHYGRRADARPGRIMILSATVDDRKCREWGVHGCLRKPFEVDALLAAIESITGEGG